MDLEDALVALGDDAGSSSAINVLWLLSGGTGLPVNGRRERLWWISGILFALKREGSLVRDFGSQGMIRDVGGGLHLNAEEVKRICMQFLRSSPA